MVLKARILMMLLALALPHGGAAEPPRPEEVSLPVRDYLELVEKGEAAARERLRRESIREAPVAEVTSQRVRISLGEGDTAEVTAGYEVLVQGEPGGPVVLPVIGVPRSASAQPSGAALSAGAKAGEWLLVAPAAGRYAVEISGPVPLSAGGVSRLALPPAVAPVSLTEVELPAGLDWSAPGMVVVEDRVEGARRTLRLTSRRGQAQALEVRRKVGGDAEKLLARSLVLTLVQLRPDGPRRHDIVLYEISRGGLGSLTVDLPPGLSVETVGTDEGEAVPVVESRRLTVQRRQQLRGVGYLVVTPTRAAGAELPLDPIVPEGPVQARYVALASSVAADARPLPQGAWSRIDLDDLPPTLRDALGGIDMVAAWRLASASLGSGAGLRMAVSTLPAAPSLPAVASLRETTTLITLDGTLLHRDRITLRPAAIGAALDLTLAPGATLWSARVDEVAVRPLERGGGKISVPLGFDTGKDAVVEVVSVQEKAIPAGRSELALDVPRVAVPVQEHRWRLLLPDGASYRFRSGDLRPAVARRERQSVSRFALSQTAIGPGTTANVRCLVADDKGEALPGVTVTLQPAGGPPIIQVTNAQGVVRFLAVPPGNCSLKAELEGFSTVEYPEVPATAGQATSIEVRLSPAVEDTITVTAEAPLLDERQVGKTETFKLDEGSGGGRRRKRASRPATPAPPSDDGFDAFEELRKGLVGGIKPLPIAIPEGGKLLLLTGVLPPEKIGVEIEVKGKK